MTTTTQLNIEAWERNNNCRLVRKDQHWLPRLLDWALGTERFWMTLRLPFGKATVYYSSHVVDPTDPKYVIRLMHEIVHVKQQRSAWGLLKTYVLYTVAPLPIYWSGRWNIEFPAYMIDILAGVHTPESAAGILYYSYLRPRPLQWMVDRFTDELRRLRLRAYVDSHKRTLTQETS